jgi:hypothetical protein
MDPRIQIRIQIHTKMSWIRNTGDKKHESSPDNSLNVFLICGQTFSPLRPPARFLCRGFLPPFKSRRRGGNDHDPLGIRAITVLFVSGSGPFRLAKTAVVSVRSGSRDRPSIQAAVRLTVSTLLGRGNVLFVAVTVRVGS